MQTNFKPDAVRTRLSNIRASRINAQQVYLISGATHTMREMISRSGKTESQLREVIKRIRSSKDRTITWEKLA